MTGDADLPATRHAPLVTFEFFQLALHELQMDVQRVERIADFVRDAGGEQRERLDAFAFDGLKRFLPRLGRVMQNQRHAGTAGGLAIERRRVEPEKTRTRIMHSNSWRTTRSPPAWSALKFFPNPIPAKCRRCAGPRIRLQADEPRDRLIKINDAPLLVRDQHAVFDGIEERFEKAALAREPLDDGLEAFRVQPPDAAKHFVEKTGFWRRH